ncbi:MAG: tetratricopeptide repeat protein [Gemmatimonadota bacterium]
MKIRFGLVLAAALGLGLTGCASGGGGSSAAATAGVDATQGQPPRETDNTEQAEEFLESAEEAGTPATAEPLYRNALTAAEAAIAEGPNNPLAHRLAALASLGLGEYAEAGSYFDRAGELYPLYEFEDAQLREQSWIELYNEAMPLIGETEYEAAVDIFEDANAIYSGRPEAFITLAQLYAQLREHDLALENLDRAAEVIESAAEEVDPETLAAWQEQAAEIPTLRAGILSDAGRFEEAAAVFEQMLVEDPSNVEAARNLAATQLQMGNEQAAFETYEALLANPSLGPIDLYQIGIGFYQGSDYTRAAQAFGQGVEGNPMDRDGLEMWTRSLQLDSAYADVPPVAERWMELDPNSQNALLILAQSVNEIGESQRAGELVQRVERLEVTVDELQMLRYNAGGARVSGTVVNRELDAGTPVTLTFTFYSIDGAPLGEVTETVEVGGEGMSELFQVEFESTETVGGYGYELTTG